MIKPRIALFLLLSALITVACAQKNAPKEPLIISGEPTNIAVANPASIYCVQLQGKLMPKKDKNGGYSICKLPNGEEIEEWKLYRRDHPEKKA